MRRTIELIDALLTKNGRSGLITVKGISIRFHEGDVTRMGVNCVGVCGNPAGRWGFSRGIAKSDRTRNCFFFLFFFFFFYAGFSNGIGKRTD